MNITPYDEESLFEIAKELGKPLKVDISTQSLGSELAMLVFVLNWT